MSLKSPAKARSWNPITPLLVHASTLACNVPIHTVITVSLLAIFSYVHLLSDSHFSISSRGLEAADLKERRFFIGEQTKWKWEETGIDEIPAGFEESKKSVLVTLDFPEDSPEALPKVTVPTFVNAVQLKSPRKESLLYEVPQQNLKAFLETVMEIPATDGAARRPERWIATVGNEGKNKYSDSWYGFLAEKLDDLWGLLEKADPFDIGIMVVGYLAMHGTFINLFLSMRRLGSKLWLAVAVLLSSTFAFFLATFVTKALGVPINVILLSEGLPFLVIVIGFEKPIILTRHVLSQSVESRRSANGQSVNDVVLSAVQERGLEIVKLYALEITVLVMGSMLGVQGLRQFCFLAAWILFFDFVLLFSFYTAILVFKLEINRIRRHATIRKALEEDGISHKAAESYASATEWPKANLEVYGNESKADGQTMFGNKVFGVRTFKIVMVGSFFALNTLYIASFWFRERADAISLFKSIEKALPEVHSFTMEESRAILESYKGIKEPTILTFLKPFGYVLDIPSATFPSSSAVDGSSYLAGSAKDSLFAAQDVYQGRPRMLAFSNIVRSLQDPLLSRFLIAILFFSVGLNGLLFNVARWSAKEQIREEKEVVPAPQKLCTCGGIIEEDDDGLMMRTGAGAPDSQPVRSTEEALALIAEKQSQKLSDKEILGLCAQNKLLVRDLERKLGDTTRAVKIRRKILSMDKSIGEKGATLDKCKLPYLYYDFDRVLGACCENVVGYLPLPLGIAGPLVIDGEKFYIPMATTEGVLVASTSRGCKAINSGGGATTVLLDDGMTRGPCVTFPTLKEAGAAKNWLDSEDGQQTMKEAFDSTSRFARLKSIKTALAGTYLYIRFKCTTGDAMGMNMISKGVEHALHVMTTECGFENMQIVSVSGNYCTDKKPAAINWIEGRGKSVVAEAIIPGDVVKNVLKCDVDGLVELNISKNLVGSAMAGSVGGFNAHAANIVTAIFLATGQDPAQNVESSNCITLMRKTANGSLQISVSMPSIEVGTLGGGTILDPQGAMLSLLGVKGTHPEGPGQNARKLARIVASAVLAGELSLCSALVAGHLVKSHMQHNRSAAPTRTNTPAPQNGGAQVPPSLRMTTSN